jgi:hypothetical protein
MYRAWSWTSVITHWPVVITVFAIMDSVLVLVSVILGSKMIGFQVLDAYPYQTSPATMHMITS